jgi:hypothetical protein
VLQMGTILYEYIEANSMTSMLIINFGGEDTFVHVLEEHCHFYEGMEPRLAGLSLATMSTEKNARFVYQRSHASGL